MFNIFEDPTGYHIGDTEEDYIFSTDTVEKAEHIIRLLEKEIQYEKVRAIGFDSYKVREVEG